MFMLFINSLKHPAGQFPADGHSHSKQFLCQIVSQNRKRS